MALWAFPALRGNYCNKNSFYFAYTRWMAHKSPSTPAFPSIEQVCGCFMAASGAHRHGNSMLQISILRMKLKINKNSTRRLITQFELLTTRCHATKLTHFYQRSKHEIINFSSQLSEVEGRKNLLCMRASGINYYKARINYFEIRNFWPGIIEHRYHKFVRLPCN